MTENEFDEDELCNVFTNKNTVTCKLSKIENFIELSGFDEKKPYENKIVSVDQFIGKYNNLKLGNGGSWCRNSAWKHHKVATMKKNGVINYLWETDNENEKNIVSKAFSVYPVTKGNSIQYFGIFGLKEQNKLRPIRSDIKDYWVKFPCVFCGLKENLVCDHKNDLYNDSRVLNTKTQTKEDFQSLCNKCNLIKRQVSKETIRKKKRYGATNIPMFKVYGIDFIEGDDTFDPDDINAMKGTFWYDPISFNEGVRNMLKTSNRCS
jgi:hypothetical protein